MLSLLSRADEPPASAERWLFVFDTASAMKRRLPAVETALQTFFLMNGGGSVRAGDTLGVWTFDRQLHAGQFPLVIWAPESAAMTSSNIVAFLRKQTYTGNTSFEALQPLVGQVIAGSERLTLVIFCDGQGEINGTPYDDSINQALQQTQAERKNARQPFVLVLRTQRGRFVGCSASFPPAALNLPPFPPLPLEAKASPANTRPPAPPAATVPALIIVGTHVGTNPEDLVKYAKPAASASPAAPTNSTKSPNNDPTNAIPAPPTPVTNAPAAKSVEPDTIQAAPAASPTNIVAAALAGSDDPGSRILIFVGVGLLASAMGLVILLVAGRRRGPRSSLITSSMQNDPRPPDQK
jgi:hypothetical protein